MLVTIPIPDPHPTVRLSQALLLAPGYGSLERPAQGTCRGMFTRAGKEKTLDRPNKGNYPAALGHGCLCLHSLC